MIVRSSKTSAVREDMAPTGKHSPIHYYLWLTPGSRLYEPLADLMEGLRQEYQGPAFDPHITLLGEMKGEEEELYENVGVLSHLLSVMEIRLMRPSFGEDYFHCLFLPIENTPDLIKAHREALQVFGQVPRLSFCPHVSLLYGLFPIQEKRRMIQTLPQDWLQSGMADEIVLIRAESTDPRDWHPIRRCCLAGKDETRDG